MLRRLTSLVCVCLALLMVVHYPAFAQTAPDASGQSNLDLGSTDRTVTASSSLGSGTVNITVGGNTIAVGAGTMLTPAENVALLQVLNGGQQTIQIGQLGNAVGGTVNLGTSIYGSSAISSLIVPQGVTAIHDFGVNGNLNLTSNFINQGNFYAVSTNTQVLDAIISAQNITNGFGGLISSALPASLNISGAISALNLNLMAVNNIVNSGSIISSANLNLTAGNSIINALPTGILGANPLMQAAGNLNLQAASIINQGTMISQLANINAITSSLNNSLGTLSALNGSINVQNLLGNTLAVNNVLGEMQAKDSILLETLASITDADGNVISKANLDLNGGVLTSSSIDIKTDGGLANMRVDGINGKVNVEAGDLKLRVENGNLTMGAVSLSGDPIIEVPAGDIAITDFIAFGGGLFNSGGTDVIFLAGGSVTAGTSVPGDTIDASNAGGTGGRIYIAAGSTWDGSLNITGASGLGGNIALPGLNLTTNVPTTGGIPAIRLTAFAGGAFNGDISIGNLTANGIGVNQAGGQVSIQASGTVNVGTISTLGNGAGVAGAVSIASQSSSLNISSINVGSSSMTLNAGNMIVLAAGQTLSAASIIMSAAELQDNGTITASDSISIQGSTAAGNIIFSGAPVAPISVTSDNATITVNFFCCDGSIIFNSNFTLSAPGANTAINLTSNGLGAIVFNSPATFTVGNGGGINLTSSSGLLLNQATTFNGGTSSTVTFTVSGTGIINVAPTINLPSTGTFNLSAGDLVIANGLTWNSANATLALVGNNTIIVGNNATLSAPSLRLSTQSISNNGNLQATNLLHIQGTGSALTLLGSPTSPLSVSAANGEIRLNFICCDGTVNFNSNWTFQALGNNSRINVNSNGTGSINFNAANIFTVGNDGQVNFVSTAGINHNVAQTFNTGTNGIILFNASANMTISLLHNYNADVTDQVGFIAPILTLADGLAENIAGTYAMVGLNQVIVGTGSSISARVVTLAAPIVTVNGSVQAVDDIRFQGNGGILTLNGNPQPVVVTAPAATLRLTFFCCDGAVNINSPYQFVASGDGASININSSGTGSIVFNQPVTLTVGNNGTVNFTSLADLTVNQTQTINTGTNATVSYSVAGIVTINNDINYNLGAGTTLNIFGSQVGLTAGSDIVSNRNFSIRANTFNNSGSLTNNLVGGTITIFSLANLVGNGNGAISSTNIAVNATAGSVNLTTGDITGTLTGTALTDYQFTGGSTTLNVGAINAPGNIALGNGGSININNALSGNTISVSTTGAGTTASINAGLTATNLLSLSASGANGVVSIANGILARSTAAGFTVSANNSGSLVVGTGSQLTGVGNGSIAVNSITNNGTISANGGQITSTGGLTFLGSGVINFQVATLASGMFVEAIAPGASITFGANANQAFNGAATFSFASNQINFQSNSSLSSTAGNFEFYPSNGSNLTVVLPSSSTAVISVPALSSVSIGTTTQDGSLIFSPSGATNATLNVTSGTLALRVRADSPTNNTITINPLVTLTSQSAFTATGLGTNGLQLVNNGTLTANTTFTGTATQSNLSVTGGGVFNGTNGISFLANAAGGQANVNFTGTTNGLVTVSSNSGGTLSYANAVSFQDLSVNGGSLDLTAPSITLAGSLSATGAGSTLVFHTPLFTNNGTISNNNNNAGQSIVFDNNGNLSIGGTGNIQSNAQVVFSVQNAGNTITFSGGTQTVQFGAQGTGVAVNSNNVQFNNLGGVAVTGNAASTLQFNTLSGADNLTVSVQSGATATVSTIGGQINFAPGQNLIFSIAGGPGNGTLFLQGANTRLAPIAGNIQVNTGVTLSSNQNISLVTVGQTITNNGILTSTALAGNIDLSTTVAGNLILNGAGTINSNTITANNAAGSFIGTQGAMIGDLNSTVSGSFQMTTTTGNLTAGNITTTGGNITLIANQILSLSAGRTVNSSNNVIMTGGTGVTLGAVSGAAATVRAGSFTGAENPFSTNRSDYETDAIANTGSVRITSTTGDVNFRDNVTVLSIGDSIGITSANDINVGAGDLLFGQGGNVWLSAANRVSIPTGVSITTVARDIPGTDIVIGGETVSDFVGGGIAIYAGVAVPDFDVMLRNLQMGRTGTNHYQADPGVNTAGTTMNMSGGAWVDLLAPGAGKIGLVNSNLNVTGGVVSIDPPGDSIDLTGITVSIFGLSLTPPTPAGGGSGSGTLGSSSGSGSTPFLLILPGGSSDPTKSTIVATDSTNVLENSAIPVDHDDENENQEVDVRSSTIASMTQNWLVAGSPCQPFVFVGDDDSMIVGKAGATFAPTGGNNLDLRQGKIIAAAGKNGFKITTETGQITVDPDSSALIEQDQNGLLRVSSLAGGVSVVSVTKDVNAGEIKAAPGEEVIVADASLSEEELISADGVDREPIEGTIIVPGMKVSRSKFDLEAMAQREDLILCDMFGRPYVKKRLSNLKKQMMDKNSPEAHKQIGNNQGHPIANPLKLISFVKDFADNEPILAPTISAFQNSTAVIRHGNNAKVVVDSNNNIHFQSGELLVDAKDVSLIRCGAYNVYLDRGSVAYLKYADKILHVANLFENKSRSIHVVHAGRKVSLSIGQSAVYGMVDSGSLSKHVTQQDIGRRRVRSIDLSSGGTLIKSEVSPISLIQSSDLLQRLVHSKDSYEQELGDRLMKMAACLLHATVQHGSYSNKH